MSMADLARQDEYAPDGVDWSRLNQPFGTLTDTNPKLYDTKAGPIYQQDIGNAIDVAMGASGGGLATKPMGEVLGIRAYHGSPHSFDRFDLSKIGTGEGAQAYGHGLYFAEAEPVAQSYKRAGPAADAQYAAINSQLSKIAKEQDALTSSGFYPGAPDYAAKKAKHVENAAVYNDLMDQRAKLGHMYEVNLNADPAHFLDWDKGLRSQSPVVQEAMRKLVPDFADMDMSGEVLHREMARPALKSTLSNAPQQASQMLSEAGIPGIRYLDQASRGPNTMLNATNNSIATYTNQLKTATGAERETLLNNIEQLKAYAKEQEAKQATSNYVVFNPSIIDILRKYGIAGAAPLGALAAQDNYQQE